MKKTLVLENVTLDKFVHGGQCIATLESNNSYAGKKVFVWGGLPGEMVDIRVTKKKSSYLEGVVDKVITPSKHRVEAKEPENFLSTSPWQIVDYDYENQSKQNILVETFGHKEIDVVWKDFEFNEKQYGYRNKLEIGFWGNEEGLHLAHFVRGSHGKVISDNNELVADSINIAARDLCSELNKLGIWAGKLKTLILRCNKASEVVGALFCKEDVELSDFRLPKSFKGLDIYYSNAKSPSSVPTKLFKNFGNTEIVDEIFNKKLTYDVLSFFQVNLEVFESALTDIKANIGREKSVDMYSGVGTIGAVLGSEVLVESDKQNIKYSIKNAPEAKVVHSSSELSLDQIKKDKVLILDPPRAGLHKRVVEHIVHVKPPKIVYLSCNPSTQARDVKLLDQSYKISFAKGYNFFPRTPHIESLLILDRK